MVNTDRMGVLVLSPVFSLAITEGGGGGTY